MKFTQLKQPIIASSLRVKTEDEAINDIKASEEDGAQAFLLHISLLEKKYRCFESIKKIISTTNKPVMALNYRNVNEYIPDDELCAVVVEAVKAGAVAVDMPGDIFDSDSISSLSESNLPFVQANPKQITMRKDCIVKQKEYINKIHEMGVEVLTSIHVGVPLTCEQAVSLAIEMQSRGVDIVKIITTCPDYEHMIEMIKTIAELKKTLKIPFLYQCGGPYGKFLRRVAPMLGSMMALCHHDYIETSNPEKPLITDVKKVFELLDFSDED